ncbi:MAG: class I SAM-dependent methyltransferase, partial [Treponema sp.]|nr:class I SAM-dependent methyltransferase [Treponema sp.]
MYDFRGTCLVCHSDQLEYLTKVRDSEKHFVYRCCVCGHVQLNPIPSEEEDRVFYQTNQMGRITVSKNIMDDEQLRLKNKAWIDKQVAFIKKIIPTNKSIFEIGSGYGWFIDEIRKAGYSADGLELSTEKCMSAKKNFNIQLYNMSYP